MIDPPEGDAFACRNEYALNIDYEEMPPMFKITDTHYAATWLLDQGHHRSNHLWEDSAVSKEVLLDVRHLTQQFHLTKKIKVKAVDDVSFEIHKGEIFWSGRRIRFRKIYRSQMSDEYLSANSGRNLVQRCKYL